MKQTLYLFLFLSSFTACTSHKLVTKNPAKSSQNLQQLITSFQQSEQDYAWIRSHGSVNYTGGGQNFSASTNIKMRKDSVIWASVSLLFELARGIINNDSATMLNRMQKEYSSFPVSDLQAMLAIPKLNLSAVQKLFMAIPPFGINSQCNFSMRDADYKLSYINPEYKEEITLDAANYRMKEYTFKKNETQKIRITYEYLDKVGDLILPKKINFEIESPEKTTLLFVINDYTLSKTDEAPFSIPASYKKR